MVKSNGSVRQCQKTCQSTNRAGQASVFYFIVLLILFPLGGCQKKSSSDGTPAIPAAAPEPVVRVVSLDPRFDQLVPPTTQIEKLADGYQWTEGPVWNRSGAFLLFTNIPGNEIVKWKEGEGASRYLQPSGYSGEAPFTGREPGSNGLTYDATGQLVMCQHGDRRVARYDATTGKITGVVDRFEGKRFNSPNDLIFHTNGDLYFTDPIYGLPKGAEDPARELDFCGVYRLDRKNKLTLLTREITRPNGIALSPDEKRLYVASSDPEKAIWMVYDLAPNGSLANERVFFDATPFVNEGRKGLPDGLKVDQAGNLFATGPGGVLVFAPDGTHLGTIETGVPTANCAWGEDGSTLFITANTALLRARLKTRGF